MMTTTASQAWAILKRHARDEIATLRLQDLCNDNDRVSSLVAVHNSTIPPVSSASTSPDKQQPPQQAPNNHNSMLLVDLSRQRMTLETLNHLLRLSVTRGVRQYITRLAWGQNNPDAPLHQTSTQTSRRSSSRRRGGGLPHVPYQHYAKQQQQQNHPSHKNNNSDNNNNPDNTATDNGNDVETIDNRGTHFPSVMPSMHLALRAPKDQGLHMLTLDGVNALTAIHREWDRLERLSNSIRRGTWRGVSGQMIRNVIVVGRGVAIQALQFVDQALKHDETAIMASRFGLDPSSSGGLGSGVGSNGGSSTYDWSGRLLRRGLGGASNNAHANVRPRKLYFLTSVDPLAASSLISELDPASTMVISFALQGNEETGLATKTMKTWLLQHLAGVTANTTTTGNSASQQSSKRVDSVLSKHMLLVTGNDQIATSINKPESVFLIPEHSRCEAFISFSAATLLPMSIVYGWSICEQFLAGGHDLDCHFVETNPRHNLPVLLALTDVWNDTLFGAASSGRIVTPFTQPMNGFPAFVASLEAQSCSGNNDNTQHHHGTSIPNNRLSCSSLVLDGGCDSAYDRALYQSSKIQYSELVMVMNTQLRANTARNLGAQGMEDVFHHADALMCSLFGHADEMAFGGKDDVNTGGQSKEPGSPMRYQQNISPGGGLERPSGQNSQTPPSEGNRPSTLLICGKLDVYACGQLIALSEHRAAIKARIWDIDPFAPEAGYSFKTPRAEQLRDDLQSIYNAQELGEESDSDDEENEGGLNLSTKTILNHYARVRT